MTITESPRTKETNQDEPVTEGITEQQVVSSAVLRHDISTGRFNHRSRVKLSPAPVEPLFSD